MVLYPTDDLFTRAKNIIDVLDISNKKEELARTVCDVLEHYEDLDKEYAEDG